MKQHAPACERNSRFILEVLRPLLKTAESVLEIASGTGQHAVCFSEQLPHLQWQPSDQPGATGSIKAWRSEYPLANLLKPEEIDLLDNSTWPTQSYDAIICINTIHIVSWQGVEALFDLTARTLRLGGLLYLYGPFRYSDRPLEPSNEQFHLWLKQRDPESGVRDLEAVNELAGKSALKLEGDTAMPANNRSVWWRKSSV